MAELSDRVLAALKDGRGTARMIADRIEKTHGDDGIYTPRSVSMACQRLYAHGKLRANPFARTDRAIVYSLKGDKADA